MVVGKEQIFNLMDTNGRRGDVLNALKVYLQILEEIKEEYPFDGWNNYPNSIGQFVFYTKALEKSKDEDITGTINIYSRRGRALCSRTVE